MSTQAQKEYYLRNKQLVKQKAKIWKRNNPKKVKLSWKNYSYKNKEKIALKNKKWKKNNPEKIYQQNIRYVNKHRDEVNRKKREWMKKNSVRINKKKKESYRKNVTLSRKKFMDWHKKNKYRSYKKIGIQPIEIKELKKRQKGRCMICNKKSKLFVDHCHKKLILRGVLCRHCNTGLGFFFDNPILLKNAIRYLTRSTT